MTLNICFQDTKISTFSSKQVKIMHNLSTVITLLKYISLMATLQKIAVPPASQTRSETCRLLQTWQCCLQKLIDVGLKKKVGLCLVIYSSKNNTVFLIKNGKIKFFWFSFIPCCPQKIIEVVILWNQGHIWGYRFTYGILRC